MTRQIPIEWRMERQTNSTLQLRREGVGVVRLFITSSVRHQRLRFLISLNSGDSCFQLHRQRDPHTIMQNARVGRVVGLTGIPWREIKIKEDPPPRTSDTCWNREYAGLDVCMRMGIQEITVALDHISCWLLDKRDLLSAALRYKVMEM